MGRFREGEYRVAIKPSVEYLLTCRRLMLDKNGMAAFLNVSPPKVFQHYSSGRIPAPINLGLGRLPRWSVLELLEWCAAGCPGRVSWIEQRGWSGHLRRWGRGLPW